MRVALLLTSMLAILCAGVVGVLLGMGPPTTEELDADLLGVRSAITQAERDRAQFAGGLALSLAQARLETLKISEALLAAKRNSVLRRVDLRYTVNGIERVTNPDLLASLELDIAEAKQELLLSEMQLARYSGGLAQAMAAVRVETNHLTIAQLTMRLLAERYGLIVPTQPYGQGQGPMGQVVVSEGEGAL